MRTLISYLSILLVLVGLSACHDDDFINLRMEDISSSTSSVHPNDYFMVNYSIRAANVKGSEIVVDFYALHDESVEDATDEETDLEHDFYLGSDTFVVDDSGYTTVERAVELHIPINVTFDGDYSIVANIDPENLIEESDEQDNVLSEDDQEHPETVIHIEIPSDHDFDVTELVFDDSFILLDAPGQVSRDGAVHVTDLIGHINAEYLGFGEGVDAHLELQALINSEWQTLQLWDSELQGYDTEVDVVFEYTHDEHYIGFDAKFTDQQVADLYAEFGATSDVELEIRAVVTDHVTSTLTEIEIANNSAETTLPLAFFEGGTTSQKTLPVLTVGTGFNKGYGDASKFRIGFNVEGELVLDSGAISGDLSGGAGIGVTAFGFSVDMIALSMEARAAYFETYAGYEVSLDLFGGSVWSTGQEGTFIEYEFERERTWEEEKELLNTSFVVGPVPMTITVGVSGEITSSFDLTVTGFNIEASSDILSIEFLANATGGINLAAIQAGVEIELTLIENVFNVTGNVGLDLNGISYGLDLTDEINAIQGRFGLFAKTFGIKWCKKRIFRKKIKYPCGTKTTTYRFWIYQTPSLFEKAWTLFSKQGVLSTT